MSSEKKTIRTILFLFFFPKPLAERSKYNFPRWKKTDHAVRCTVYYVIGSRNNYLLKNQYTAEHFVLFLVTIYDRTGQYPARTRGGGGGVITVIGRKGII